MSKRCELQKEYYQANGNYKGNGKYNDEYVRWLEDQTLALRIHGVVGRSEQFYCTCSRAKGLDHDEEGTPYCISCQKEVQ
jgi:hypothetical protein